MNYLDKDYLITFANDYYKKTHRKSDGLHNKKYLYYKQPTKHSLHFQLSLDKYSDNIISFYFEPNVCIYEDENNGIYIDISPTWEKYKQELLLQNDNETEM